MTTATQRTTNQQKLSTLDVLWAFYQSQPPQVRKAFLIRLESQKDLESHQAIWQHDLKEIASLKDNWDGNGAPRINKEAIQFARRLMKSLEIETANNVRLFPTPLGAVLLKLETDKGRLKCEMGDSLMSYFIKTSNGDTKHHSFEEINKETLAELKSSLENLVL